MKIVNKILFLTLFSLISVACSHVQNIRPRTIVGQIYKTDFTVYVDGLYGEGSDYPISRVHTLSQGFDLKFIFNISGCKFGDQYLDLDKFEKDSLFSIEFDKSTRGYVFDYEENGNRVVAVARKAIKCEKLAD